MIIMFISVIVATHEGKCLDFAGASRPDRRHPPGRRRCRRGRGQTCGTQTLPKSCKESLSAFANTRGGVLILGLDEIAGFAATGVTKPAKLMKDLASLCATGMTPPLRPHIELQSFEGVDLIVCEVDELPSPEKPCYITSSGMANGSYVRVHDGDQRLSQYEIQLLLANRGQPVDDGAAVYQADLAT